MIGSGYGRVARRLLRYERAVKDGTIMYLKDGKIIATKRDNTIVLYFQCSPDIIWNHKSLVMIAIVKNFIILKNYKKTISDLLVVSDLSGSCNSIECETNQLLRKKAYWQLDIRDIGSIGYATAGGKFYFYDGLTIDVPEDMCNFDFNSLNYCILKKKNPIVKKMLKCEDYRVYNTLRRDMDWYYNEGAGIEGSNEVRERIEKTRNGTNFHKLSRATIIKTK